MIVDVVLRLHMRQALSGEALQAWLESMEDRIEASELCETAYVAGSLQSLSSEIASLLRSYGINPPERRVG